MSPFSPKFELLLLYWPAMRSVTYEWPAECYILKTKIKKKEEHVTNSLSNTCPAYAVDCKYFMLKIICVQIIIRIILCTCKFVQEYRGHSYRGYA